MHVSAILTILKEDVMLLQKTVVGLLAVCLPLAAAQLTATITKPAAVYEKEFHSQYEKPLYSVSKGDKLDVLQQKDLTFQVRNRGYKTGWINRDVCTIKTKSTSFTFDPTQVEGFIDNTGTILVPGSNLLVDDTIKLNRSFRNALVENVDKETIERM